MIGFVKYHDELKALMKKHKDEILETEKINSLFIEEYPTLDIKYMQPSDHCYDKTCKGACFCSMKEEAIFDYLGRKTYRVR